MNYEMVIHKQHQCWICGEILADDYIEQYPFPELPCPACGSHIEIFSDIEKKIASQPIRNEELKVTYKSFKRFIVDYTKNVSKGGMFIKTKSSHEIGSTLDVLLHVPRLDEPIRIRGRVIHNSSFSDEDKDNGIGIEFIDIDKISRDMLIITLKAQNEVK